MFATTLFFVRETDYCCVVTLKLCFQAAQAAAQPRDRLGATSSSSEGGEGAANTPPRPEQTQGQDQGEEPENLQLRR